MILVAGGTGRLGTLVTQRLAERGESVRVLTRDPERAQHLDGLAEEIVVGDVRRADTLEPALVDVGIVVSAVHGFAGPGRVKPASVDRDGNANLIAAAAAAGADMVLVSVVGASPKSPMELFRCKYAAEQRLQASELGWTIVRATAFIELWADILSNGIVFGRGDNPINFVSVRDVAAEVERAVLEPGLRGEIVEVGGPENLTLNQFADLLHETTGQPTHFRHIPRLVLRATAPLHRQPRAALVMDTSPMTYHAPDHAAPTVTTVKDALQQGLVRPESAPPATATASERPENR